MRYGRTGTMRVRPGHRDEVVAALTSGLDSLREVGCHVYLVGTSDDDTDLIWIHEVWDSREAHQASLRLPETKAAIAAVMPLLTGEFTNQDLDIADGGVAPGKTGPHRG